MAPAHSAVLKSEDKRQPSAHFTVASFDDRWSPKTLCAVGDYAVKAVKIEGVFVWHDHADDDELFYVLSGGISMEYRLDGAERVVRFGSGEMLRVPSQHGRCAG